MVRVPPYLPFLDGPASLNVRAKPIELSAWLTPDTEAAVPGVMDSKERHLEDYDLRREVFRLLPSAWEAANEAGLLVLDHVMPDHGFAPDNYPRGSWLFPASLSVSDDLCVMVPEDGSYRLSAASLCAASYWSLERNIGLPLGGLHQPLPGQGAGLEQRIVRVFDGLQPDVILERFNWTVQFEDQRHMPSSGPMLKRLSSCTPDVAAEHLYLRVERQTLRKLPQTNAVLFTIRVALDPLGVVLSDADHRMAFVSAWSETAEDIRTYKQWSYFDPAVEWLLRTI